MMRIVTDARFVRAGHEVPDGLDRGRPRNVRLTGSGRALIAAAVFLAAASVPAFVALEIEARADADRLALLRAQGRPIPMVTFRGEGRGNRRQRPWRPMPAAVPYAAGLSLLAGGALALLALRPQRRLLAEGRVVRATVRSHAKSPRAPGAYALTYEFRTLGGTLASGTVARTGAPPATGEPVWVIYDADDPLVSRPYPFPLVQPLDKRPLRR